MRKYHLVCCSLLFSLSIISQENFHATSITHGVNQRFYLISRLNQIVQLIAHNLNNGKNVCHINLYQGVFQHTAIKETIEQIKEKKNLLPLLHLWEAFITYRFINDTLFEKELIRLLLLVCYQVSTEKCIEKNITEKNNGFEINNVSTDDITRNFYTIQRMNRCIENLTTMQNEMNDLLEQNQPKRVHDLEDITFLEEKIPFEHNKIRECIYHIYQQKELTPLLDMYRDYTSYRYASDYLFLKEQLHLLFLVHKNMLTKKLSNQNEQIIIHEMEFIQDVCEHIEELSIDQILDVIDMITNKLMAIRKIEDEFNHSFVGKIYNAAHSISSFFNNLTKSTQ